MHQQTQRRFAVVAIAAAAATMLGSGISASAATPALMRHRGRAYVFETRDQMMAEIDRDDLAVDAVYEGTDVFDAHNASLKHLWPLDGQKVDAVAYSQDGTVLAIGKHQPAIALVNADTGHLI